MTWQPIETAPRDGSWVIVGFAGWPSPTVLRWMEATEFDAAGWYDEPVDCHYEHDVGPCKPTHWLAHPPIPSTP